MVVETNKPAGAGEAKPPARVLPTRSAKMAPAIPRTQLQKDIEDVAVEVYTSVLVHRSKQTPKDDFSIRYSNHLNTNSKKDNGVTVEVDLTWVMLKSPILI